MYLTGSMVKSSIWLETVEVAGSSLLANNWKHTIDIFNNATKSRIQSYDRELQRQRSKNLQRQEFVHFENKNIFFQFEKSSSLLQRWHRR
jgi:hypothetical protein